MFFAKIRRPMAASRIRTIVLLLAVVASACRSSDPRRAVAERFIDELYVEIDQAAARELATGLAVSKLDDEIRLKQGQEIDAATRQPHIGYTFVQADAAGGETSSLVYDLRVTPDGADAFTRRLVLTLRQVDGAWKVANYTLEAPPGGPE
jgi:hypothetical protein